MNVINPGEVWSSNASLGKWQFPCLWSRAQILPSSYLNEFETSWTHCLFQLYLNFGSCPSSLTFWLGIHQLYTNQVFNFLYSSWLTQRACLPPLSIQIPHVLLSNALLHLVVVRIPKIVIKQTHNHNGCTYECAVIRSGRGGVLNISLSTHYILLRSTWSFQYLHELE